MLKIRRRIKKIIPLITSDPIQRLKLNYLVDSVVQIIAQGLLEDYKINQSEFAVRRKYEAVAGDTIRQKYSSRKEYYLYRGKIKSQTFAEYNHNKCAEYARILRQFPADSILEVGAGELTTLANIMKMLRGKKYYALELSPKRIAAGIAELKRLGWATLPRIMIGSACHMPYPDNCFDLVYTSHCLEQIPDNYRMAIKEIIRVAKKYVVLFEPGYELGNLNQKLYIKAHNYVRGIYDYLKTIGNVKILGCRLLNNNDLINPTAVYLLKINK